MAWVVKGVHVGGDFKGKEFLLGKGGMAIHLPVSGKDGYDKKGSARWLLNRVKEVNLDSDEDDRCEWSLVEV